MTPSMEIWAPTVIFRTCPLFGRSVVGEGPHVDGTLCPFPTYADASEKMVSRKPLGSLTSNARLFHSVS
jgi:hypothetical protein